MPDGVQALQATTTNNITTTNATTSVNLDPNEETPIEAVSDPDPAAVNPRHRHRINHRGEYGDNAIRRTWRHRDASFDKPCHRHYDTNRRRTHANH